MKFNLLKSYFLAILLLSGITQVMANEVIIGTGTGTTSAMPAYGYYDYGWSAMLYSPTEVGAAATISKLEFYKSTTGSYTFYNQKVYMAVVNDSVFSSSAYITPSSVNATLVYNSSVNFSYGAGYRGITLQTPYVYNGTGHLLILWENRDGNYSSGSPQFRVSNTTNIKAKFKYRDGSFPAYSGSTSTNRPNIKLTYTPLYTTNLALSQWVYPQSGASASNSMPISIKITNTGSQAQSNYNIKYSIDNGSTWASQSVTASLAPGNSVNLTFITPAAMGTAGTYNCIAVVKKSGDTIPQDDTLRKTVTICGGQFSGNYTIGNQSGDDFLTLNDAFDAIQLCGMSASVNLKLRAGTYTSQVHIPYISGLSSTKKITIETLSGQKDVLINYASSTNQMEDFAAVNLDSTQYITLKNLTIKASGTYGAHSILFNRASNNTIEQCELQGSLSNSTSANFSVVRYHRDYYSNSINNIVKNCYVKNGSYSFYMYGTSSNYKLFGNKIFNNTIKDYVSYGIYGVYSDSVQIRRNHLIHNNGTAYSAIQMQNSVYNLDISANRIESDYGRGISFNYCTMNSSYDAKVYNNFISINTSANATIYGLYVYNSSYIKVEHNSVYLSYANSGSINSYGIYNYYGSGNTIRNNSFVNNAGNYAVYIYNTTPAIFDYNNYYSSGSVLAYYNGNRSTLSALQSASSTNYHSVSSTGVYYSAGNLHSNSSALNGTASPSTFVTRDIDNETRSTTAPDMGADEFDILSLDGGVLSINGLNNLCPNSQSAISISLKNFGTSTLTSAYVSIDFGSTSLSQSWSGFLSPGSSANVLMGSYSFSADTVYTIKAYVDSVNHQLESNHYNDTIVNNHFRTSLSGSYTIGSSSTADFSSLTDAISEMQTQGICGPVALNFENGTYQGNYTFSNNIAGLSSTNTITIGSVANDSSMVTLEYDASSSGDNYIFYFNNNSHFKVKNLTLKPLDNNYNRVFYIYSSNDIDIENCLLIGKSTNGSSYGLGFQIQYSSDILIKNNIINHFSRAVSLNGTSSSYITNIEVLNNKITNYLDYGIYAYYTDTIKIKGNSILDDANGSTSKYGIYIERLNYFLEIGQNNIRAIGTANTFGIRMNYVNYYSSSSAAQIKVYNNMIHTSSISSNYGIYYYRGYYPQFYYNSIKVDGSNSSNTGMYAYYGYNLSAKNNNISCQSGYAGYFYYGSLNQVDYNNYYSTGNYLMRKNSSSYSTLSSFVSSTGKDSHSKNVNPNFIGNDDLHIFNQLLNDAGYPISGITVDIDNETRSTFLPDIGADEFSLLSRDVLPLAIDAPINPAGIGSNAIKVRIKNQGTSTLYSCNIFYQLDNGTIDSNYWTGSLGFLGVDSLINLGTETISAGSHSLKVWTKNPNGTTDLNTSNDTLLYNFNAITKPVIAVNPTILTDSILSCSGTKQQSLKVYNNGSANLTINVGANSSGGSTIDILAIKLGYYSSAYNNAKSAIQNGVTNAVITETTTTSTATLTSLLQGKEIVLIPRLSSTGYSSTYQSFGPILQNFVNNGGTVIFMGSQGSYANNIWNTGLWTGSYSGYMSSGYSITINQSNNPIFDNINYITTYYYYTRYTINNTDATTLASYAGYPVISERTIGSGKTILLGLDMYYTNTTAALLLCNSIRYGANNSDFLSNSSISSTITPGDSTTVNVNFVSNGLSTGWHVNQLQITNNDQTAGTVVVPCSLYVEGPADIRFNSSFHSFGSIYTGTSRTDSFYVYNDGCGDLMISNITSNNSYLVPLTTHDTLAPGDSSLLYFKFQPSVQGSYAMAATVISNDTNYILNFAGSAAPAPDLSTSPNPLTATIVTCGDSLIVPLTISNIGGATLTGTAVAPSDSIEVLMLTYGTHSTARSRLVNSLDQTFTKYNLTQSYISSVSQLQAAIQNKDVVVIPYISSSSSTYSNAYSSFASTLQSFANAGGTIIYAGQYYSTYLTSSGFFSNISYSGGTDYKTVTVNTQHPITTGLSSSFSTGTQDFYYYTNNNTSVWTNLVSYGSYMVSGIRNYGAGHVIMLGFNYYSVYYTNIQILASNCLSYASSNTASWIDFNSYNFSLTSGSNGTLNVKFKSQGLATGSYTGNIKITSNDPGNPTTLVPCTLNVQNQLPNAADLGPDTTWCGPATLDAGSGYSSYQWSTGNTSQTITAATSGYYMVTVSNGGQCSARDTILITINPLPTPTILGLPSAACTNGNPITLSGTPTGGSFSGAGINGNVFYPANLGLGTTNVSYSVTNSYGCTGSALQTVQIYNPPTVSLSGLATLYCPQGTASTMSGIPSGGTFSGAGVVGNVFNPSLAGSGSHDIIYNYSDIHGCASADTFTTSVSAYTQNTVSGYVTSYCANDESDTLVATISGTTFSGPGISGNIFNPATAGAGTHNIFYNYSDGTGCSYTDTVQITVHALPSNVSISGLNTDYCIDYGDEYISGYPSGGTFGGPGVVGNQFYTNLAGAGSHAISYEYTDANGCTNSDTAYVDVYALPSITISNLNSDYCVDNGSIALTASPAGGTFSGNGVSANSFDPQVAGIGTHFISYSYTDVNSCSNMDSASVNIHSLPTVSFTGLPASACSNGNIINLAPSPMGGTFSGNGVSGNSFDPSNANVGSNTITYTYTDNYGCTNTDQNSINILQVQQVNVGADQSISYNTSTQFNPIVSGGSGSFAYSWSPASSVVNASILNPTTTNLTTTTLFRLQVTDNSTSCVNSDSALVTVTGGVLSVVLNASQSSVCNGNTTQIIANGSGGSGNYTYSWTSTPSGFTSTSSTINVSPSVNTTYTCVINDGTNTASSDQAITVKTKPNAQISNLANAYCSNEAPVTITSLPVGGTLSGSGISGSDFNPANASLGQNLITYTVTSSNGCFDVDSVYVEIKETPSANAGIDTTLPCQNGGYQIGQQPFNNIHYSWYPNFGLNSDTIANPFATPNYAITYVLTATHNNGCMAHDTVHINIVGGPNATASNDTSICKGETLTLNVSGGTSYLWSTGDTTNSITVTPTQTTEYFVLANQSNCADLDTVTVTVNHPNPRLGKDTTICAGTSLLISPGIFQSYLWSTGSVAPYISVDSTGVGFGTHTITVEVFDANGCSEQDTISVSFKNCTGIFEQGKDAFAVNVYPNPSKGNIKLKSSATNQKNLRFEIMDINGKILYRGSIENKYGYFEQSLNLTGFAKGMYFIKMSTDTHTESLKISIQ